MLCVYGDIIKLVATCRISCRQLLRAEMGQEGEIRRFDPVRRSWERNIIPSHYGAGGLVL